MNRSELERIAQSMVVTGKGIFTAPGMAGSIRGVINH
jgi:hypothetical protein